MKSNGNRYSPAFKVVEALRAPWNRVLHGASSGVEAQVAQAYGVHPVTLAKQKEGSV